MNKYEQEMLTAAALEYLNRTNERGIITSSGKFEGEPIAAVALWNIALEGFADVDSTDCDGTPYYEFFMSRAELADYGLESYASEDIDSYYVVLVESEQGFVSLSVNTTPIDDSDCDESDYDDPDFCDCDECRAEREAQSMYADNDSPEYIYPLPFDESAYLAARAAYDAGTHDNNMTSAIELYEWKRDKPDSYFLYITDVTQWNRARASTWMGDFLGRVSMGRVYFSNMGDKRQPITVYGTNGVTYYGTYFVGTGDYARIRAYKNQSR